MLAQPAEAWFSGLILECSSHLCSVLDGMCLRPDLSGWESHPFLNYSGWFRTRSGGCWNRENKEYNFSMLFGEVSKSNRSDQGSKTLITYWINGMNHILLTIILFVGNGYVSYTWRHYAHIETIQSSLSRDSTNIVDNSYQSNIPVNCVSGYSVTCSILPPTSPWMIMSLYAWNRTYPVACEEVWLAVHYLLHHHHKLIDNLIYKLMITTHWVIKITANTVSNQQV